MEYFGIMVSFSLAFDSSENFHFFSLLETLGKEYHYQILDLMKAITSRVNTYGKIVEKKFYYDSLKSTDFRAVQQQQHQMNTNFSFINCPTHGNKKSLDKKMLVDILGFAWERTHRQRSSCVVLITADEDYSYALTKLRDLGVKTIFIHGHITDISDILLDCCDISLGLDEIFHDSFDVFDDISDCESDFSDEESLFGEQIEINQVAEDNPLGLIAPKDFAPLGNQDHWSLSLNDPIFSESLPFQTESSYSLFSHFKGFPEFSTPSLLESRRSDQDCNSSTGTYNLWQSRPSNDIFYLLHNSCFPSSG